jgi:hypothetical protein
MHLLDVPWKAAEVEQRDGRATPTSTGHDVARCWARESVAKRTRFGAELADAGAPRCRTRDSYRSSPEPFQECAEAPFEGFASDVPAADHHVPAADPDAIDHPTPCSKDPTVN